MFMHKGKKGPGQVEDENTVKDVKEDSCCNSDAVCKEAYDKVFQELVICKKELEDGKERLVRVTADLQNFQRRVEKEKVQWINIAQTELLHGVLSVVDDFDRAMQESEKELSPEVKVFFDGFSMTYKSFCKFLDDIGVKEITETKKFDPALHEAISQIDSVDNESGDIVVVAQKGYMFKNQVLRPAKVVVSK
ncbi:MAG: Protein GrpE [candidate division TM6 bacterium GW2011_GWF2_30_66]|jgi:molecular chaperone GrpE|nr:MAG: Protein GrpE [candidate division TM6 bacterium GW2011_GWF2_30_66]